MKKLVLAFLFLAAIGGLLIVSKDPRFSSLLIASPRQGQNTTSQTPTTTPKPVSPTITITANGFSPQTLTIKTGAQVVWANNSGKMANVSYDTRLTRPTYPELNLGNFANATTVSLTFPKSGTYTYKNSLNPSQHGTIIVQ